MAKAFLHWGVTSAMVTGARNDQGIAERDAINHGIFPGPAALSGRSSICRAADRTASGRNNYKPGAGDRIARTPEEAPRAGALSNRIRRRFHRHQ